MVMVNDFKQNLEFNVKKRIFILFATFALLGNEGCRWNDDFRVPKHLELQPRATLNPDSIDYVEDDTNVEAVVDNTTPLPDVDALSKIPPLPEHPAGADAPTQR